MARVRARRVRGAAILVTWRQWAAAATRRLRPGAEGP